MNVCFWKSLPSKHSQDRRRFTLATYSLARLSFSSSADIFCLSCACRLTVIFLSLSASCTLLSTLPNDLLAFCTVERNHIVK